MNADSLMGAPVRLSAPDGRAFDFRVADLIPYAGETYVVLAREGKDEELLITHLETDADGAPVFVVAQEEDIIEHVMEKRVAKAIQASIAAYQDEEPCACHDHDCACHHHE